MRKADAEFIQIEERITLEELCRAGIDIEDPDMLDKLTPEQINAIGNKINERVRNESTDS